MSAESKQPEVAVIGAEFRPSDTWRCQCGKEHGFSFYAAVHWSDELTHTCGCGRSRTFLDGEVVEDGQP